MHVLELYSALQAELYQQHTAPILSKVIMRGKIATPVGYNSDGTVIFSGEAVHEFEVTDRIHEDSPIRISSDKPEFPGEDGTSTRASNIRISLINTDGYIAVTQDGAKLNAATIQHVEFDVYATVNGQDLLLHRARVVGMPLEEDGKTTFNCRDTMWDAIKTPVRMPMIDEDQDLSVNTSGNLDISFHEIGGVFYSDAYAYYDAHSHIKPAFQISDKSKVDLKQVGFPLGDYPLGRYEIEFINSTLFEFRSPNRGPETGNINSAFISADGIGIYPNDWDYDINADLKGAKLTFWTYFTAEGNPITIIKHLLEWGLSGSWGSVLTEPAHLPVNWADLSELESYHTGRKVYVSETNKDNSVFADGKQLSIKRLVEMIAAHVLAFPAFDEEGKFTLISNQMMPSRFAYEINSDMVESHSIGGGENIYNKLTVGYGFDDLQDQYFGSKVYVDQDIPPYNPSAEYDPGDRVEYQGLYYYCKETNPTGSFDPTKWYIYQGKDLSINFRYYKLGASFTQIKTVGNLLWVRAQLSGVKLQATVISQFGVSLQSGDKINFNLTRQPKINAYFELVSVQKAAGQNAAVSAVLIPFGDYQKPGNWCEGFYCTGNYCY